MFKIADYLVQSQSGIERSPLLRPLDSRGGKGLLYSVLVMAGALIKILAGRLSGDLIGVHLNVAERLSIVRKGLLLAFARGLRLPVVLHLHAAQLPAFYDSLPGFGKVLLRSMFQNASVCVVLGDKAKAFVVDVLAVPVDKVKVLVNGVPISPAKKKDVPEDGRFRIFFLGNLMERKGVSDLLKALGSGCLKNRSDWVATFAGGGDVKGYSQMSVDLGISDRVNFVGWASQDVAAELMENSDVMILPSYDEGLPLVILEAFGRSVPVICTPVGEIPDFLTDRVHALFVDPGNVGQIAAALVEVIDDAELRSRIARNGNGLYEQRFSFRGFVDSIYSIYDEYLFSGSVERLDLKKNRRI